MNSDNIIWKSGESIVTRERVRTRMVTVALDDIDLVEVRRPLLGGATLLCAASLAITARFSDVLLTTEILSIIGLGVIALTLGLVTARLKLHSYSIDGIAITLPIWHASSMRNAIEKVFATRGTSHNRPPLHGRIGE